MPAGPVCDMVAALEGAGAAVVTADLDSDRLDAVSQWDGRQAPLVLVGRHAPGDRCRFSLAHELGHLVMHQQPGNGPDQEKEADAFAAEFLMPAADIRSDLTGAIDLARLAGLKRKWRVSMAALLRRAQTLGTITDWHYRSVQVEMSALGYRTQEPVPLAHEHPRLLPNLVAKALEGGADVGELAACARLLPDDFHRLYMPHEPGGTDRSVKPAGGDDTEAPPCDPSFFEVSQ
jgi:Zn-dependent peptidase ImmA (M78 family)